MPNFDSDLDRKAAQIAEKKTKFFKSFITYLVMTTFFIVLDAITGEGTWWYWPAMGWGLAIVMQFLSIFGFNDEAYKQKAFERERKKLAEQKGIPYYGATPLPDYKNRPKAQKLPQNPNATFNEDELL